MLGIFSQSRKLKKIKNTHRFHSSRLGDSLTDVFFVFSKTIIKARITPKSVVLHIALPVDLFKRHLSIAVSTIVTRSNRVLATYVFMYTRTYIVLSISINLQRFANFPNLSGGYFDDSFLLVKFLAPVVCLFWTRRYVIFAQLVLANNFTRKFDCLFNFGLSYSTFLYYEQLLFSVTECSVYSLIVVGYEVYNSKKAMYYILNTTSRLSKN